MEDIGPLLFQLNVDLGSKSEVKEAEIHPTTVMPQKYKWDQQILRAVLH